jgi:glycosyltransferase involved in cell wall biosynthesis
MGNAVSVVVPIGAVVRSMPWVEIVECIVVDNGSTDGTGEVARQAGARVVMSPRGYGAACWAGTVAAAGDVLVFLDGDGADTLEDFGKIVGPVLRGEADFCIGSRIRGKREPGALSPPQVLAGHLIGWLVKLMYGYRYSDMGAFRAIRKDVLIGLGMTEMTFGWNLEMQVRAVQCGLRIAEVPTDYKCRAAGVSKVSGNPSAAGKTVWRIVQVLLRTRARREEKI